MVRGNRIAVIPARGGSKRLPRKNILEFGGRPMLVWTIEATLECNLFDRIIVSTEDAEIADIARAHGIEVPFLRERLADDITPSSAVTILVLGQLRQVLGEEYETVVQLMPNCPLRNAADIRTAITIFESNRRNFQISCTRFDWRNPWWALQRDDDGRGEWMFSEAAKKRSQDLPPLYCPTGAIWIARVSPLCEAGTFYGPEHRFEPLPWQRAVDIDEREDLEFATALLNMRKDSGHGGQT